MGFLCTCVVKLGFSRNSRAEFEVYVVVWGVSTCEFCVLVQAGLDCALALSKAGVYFRISKPIASLHFPKHVFLYLSQCGAQEQTLPQPVWISEEGRDVPSWLTLVPPVTWIAVPYPSPVSPQRLLRWYAFSFVLNFFAVFGLFVIWGLFFLKWEGHPNVMLILVSLCSFGGSVGLLVIMRLEGSLIYSLLDEFPASASISPVASIAPRYNFLLFPLPGYLTLMQWSCWETTVPGMRSNLGCSHCYSASSDLLTGDEASQHTTLQWLCSLPHRFAEIIVSRWMWKENFQERKGTKSRREMVGQVLLVEKHGCLGWGGLGHLRKDTRFHHLPLNW